MRKQFTEKILSLYIYVDSFFKIKFLIFEVNVNMVLQYCAKNNLSVQPNMWAISKIY